MSNLPTPPPETASQVPPPTTVGSRQWTYREVAAVKRVSVETVKRWVRLGMIPSPIYTGATARFSPEQVHQILSEVSKAGTYPVSYSLRREVGRMGGMNAKRPNEKRPGYKKAGDKKVKALSQKPKPKSGATQKATKTKKRNR